MKAKIFVTLKNGVLDVQGKAIEGSLHNLGFANVNGVKQGKFIEVIINESDEEKAKVVVENMCKTLLANTVIEDYKYELVA
jgi:phosphoribosylformylglycinamidine synthase subunit PurS